MLPYLTGGLFIAALGGFYALTYVLNQKTPVPDDCKDLFVGCAGCTSVACGHNPVQQVKEN